MKKIFAVIITLFCISTQAQITYKYGKFTGSGAARAFTGLGFAPEAVIIKSEAAYQAIICTSDMPAGECKAMATSATALQTAKFTSLDADGFTVTSHDDVNKAGTVYHFIAFDEGGDLIVGTYEGDDAVEDVNISFQPEMIWIMGDEADSQGDAVLYLESNVSETNDFASGSNSTNKIDSDASGFVTKDLADSPDNDGVNYYYLAFNSGAGTLDVGGWTNGGDVDGQARSTAGTFQPDFVITDAGINNHAPVFRIASLSGDETLAFGAEAKYADGIQSFTATGFTIGTEDRSQDEHNEMDYMAMAGGSLSLLPIELLSFNVQNTSGNVVEISWTTGSEINNDFFQIERSSNGIDFEVIETIHGAGNSNDVINYKTFDTNPPEGIVYYRIRQVDFDGTNEVFRIKSIFIGNENKVDWTFTRISEGNQIRIHGELEGQYHVRIIDVNGKIVFDSDYDIIQKGMSSINIELGNKITPGVYLVNVIGNTNKEVGRVMIK